MKWKSGRKMKYAVLQMKSIGKKYTSTWLKKSMSSLYGKHLTVHKGWLHNDVRVGFSWSGPWIGVYSVEETKEGETREEGEWGGEEKRGSVCVPPGWVSSTGWGQVTAHWTRAPGRTLTPSPPIDSRCAAVRSPVDYRMCCLIPASRQ